MPKRKVYFKLILFFIGFVGLSALLASAYQVGSMASLSAIRSSDRGPASVLYNDDGEEVFWDQSLDEVNSNARGDKDLEGSNPRRRFGDILSLAKADALVTPEEATRKTGFRSTRGRLANFNVDAFSEAVRAMEPGSRQRVIELALFKDTKLKIRLERPSVHSTNDGVYWGVVEGDESSRVRLFVAGVKMNANIETKGHLYKIVDAGGQGSGHYVIEEDKSNEDHR